MSTKKHSDGNNPKAYTNKEQWEDDLDLPPIKHLEESIKKPILEKAAFDKNRKKSKRIPMLILLVAGLALIMGTYFIFRESKNEKLQQATNKEDLQIVDNETKIIEQVEDSAVIEVKPASAAFSNASTNWSNFASNSPIMFACDSTFSERSFSFRSNSSILIAPTELAIASFSLLVSSSILSR